MENKQDDGVDMLQKCHSGKQNYKSATIG